VTPEPLLTTARLAEALGVSRRWIYQQVEEHEMPAYRLPGGRTLLFRLSAAEAWLTGFQCGDWASCNEQHDGAGISDEMQEQRGG
jgi:excisionase family DNA binding protein